MQMNDTWMMNGGTGTWTTLSWKVIRKHERKREYRATRAMVAVTAVALQRREADDGSYEGTVMGRFDVDQREAAQVVEGRQRV